MDDAVFTSLIERTQKPLFGFVLSLSSTGRQAAFELAVSSYSDTLRSSAEAPPLNDFRRSLFKTALQRCRRVAAATGPDLSGPEAFSLQTKAEMRLIKEAMFSLSFEQKSLLLLRDQQHFSYEDMAVILNEPPKDVKAKVLEARDTLRDKMKKLLG